MAERVFLGSPIPSAGGRVLVSPFQFLVTGEDNLRIDGWNTVTGCVLTVAWRFADLDGTIRPYERTVPLTADRTKTTVNVPLGVGYLVNLAVYASGAAPRVGQTFVSVKLIRGFTGAMLVLGWLVQGYVTAEQALGWPGSAIQSSTTGEAVVRTILGTAPAAGAVILETVPTGARWELIMVYCQFTTTGAGAAREVVFSVPDAALFLTLVPNTATIPISVTVRLSFGPNLSALSDSTFVNRCTPFPQPLVLLAAQQFQISAFNLVAGDQFTAPQYQVREWLEVDA